MEVSDYIEEIMNNEFNTLCEDGSLEEIGESMCHYYKLIKDGKESEVIKELEKYKGSSIHLCKTLPNQDDTLADEINKPLEDNQIDQDISKKVNKNEPDEDGWVTVSKGKRK